MDAALFHTGSSGVDVATCLTTPLMKVANGSTSLSGQYGGPIVVAAAAEDDGVLRRR